MAEHIAWGDVKLVRDRATGRHMLKVRFKKTKTDPRVESSEAAGDGDWAVVGGVDTATGPSLRFVRVVLVALQLLSAADAR